MIQAKLVRDTEVRTADTMVGEDLGETTTRIDITRTVRLALTDAPVMETGYSTVRRYRPKMLTLNFKDGKLTAVETWGYILKGDGTLGTRHTHDDFSPDGERRYYMDLDACPAEIMEIVRRYAA